jgi:hypothetical protein
MEVRVEKWIVDDCVSYKILDIDKCCDRLINSKNINLNNEFDENDIYAIDDRYSIKITRSEFIDEDFGDTYFYETINYCPWCGSRIDIEIINTIDKTEEYKQLKTERDILWKKVCKTDSRKKESEIREQIRELDKKMNYMLSSDDFEKDEEN